MKQYSHRLWSPMGVRQNQTPHGKTKNLTAKPKNLTAKPKNLTAKPNASWQKQKFHGKIKYLTARFCRDTHGPP